MQCDKPGMIVNTPWRREALRACAGMKEPEYAIAKMKDALKLAAQLVAKAEADGAYKGCAFPLVGERGLRSIQIALAIATGEEIDPVLIAEERADA